MVGPREAILGIFYAQNAISNNLLDLTTSALRPSEISKSRKSADPACEHKRNNIVEAYVRMSLLELKQIRKNVSADSRL